MTSTKDLIEQFADGEPVSPDALVAALATDEGREHLRGVLELRALMAETPAMIVTPAAPHAGRSGAVLRIAAAALIAVSAAAGGYIAGQRETNLDNPPTAAAERVDAPPAPTTVIQLDATHGWRDQSGGF